jgi:hypothetical protein
MTGKVLEGEHLSLYRGSVRETWREGSHTADSKTHVIEGSGRGAFLFTGNSIRGTERYLEREGLSNMFIGPEPVLDIFFCYV